LRQTNRLIAPLDLKVVRKSTAEKKDQALAVYAQADSPVARPIPREFGAETWVMTVLPDGTRIWVDLGDLGVSRPAMSDSYETAETTFIQAHLAPGHVFIDVGANIGWFTLKAAKQVGPTGKVYAFEPRPDSFAALTRSLAENHFEDIVAAHNLALSDQPGTLNIGWSKEGENSGGTWLLSDPAVEALFLAETHRKSETVVVRLDDLIDPSRIDVLKIDIEGAELRALRGAEQLLRRHRPIILTEISAPLLPLCSDCTAAEYLAWLIQLGYRAHVFGTDGVIGEAISHDGLPPDREIVNVVLYPL
jgi:FkbM family methyltransferase